MLIFLPQRRHKHGTKQCTAYQTRAPIREEKRQDTPTAISRTVGRCEQVNPDNTSMPQVFTCLNVTYSPTPDQSVVWKVGNDTAIQNLPFLFHHKDLALTCK
jgi:hypothetical protein